MSNPCNIPLRIGAVTYLNARPLTQFLGDFLPAAQIVFDLPSRLADQLVAGDLDVAMIPSIEYARRPNLSIVSDACVSCDGEVRSVRLFGRVPVDKIRTLAVDEGSRTSVALALILLRERYNLNPITQRLPIDASIRDVDADAILLIGDRSIVNPDGEFVFQWDLGEEWSSWTGLPFVFAMWSAGVHVSPEGLNKAFSAARDEGEKQLATIAEAGAASLGIEYDDCLSYLRDNLAFRFGARQREGLETFYRLAARQGLALTTTELIFYQSGCKPPAAKVLSSIDAIIEKTLSGERLSNFEGLRLLESNDLAKLGRAADAIVRKLHPEPYRTYNIDRNINYTNVCIGRCRFCAFSCAPDDPSGYVIKRDELFRKIDQAIELGGDQILLQGGMNPNLTLEWYEDLLEDICRHYPQINIHGLSPSEIDHLSRTSNLPVAAVLRKLKDAGLGSLPGGGAEILVDRVRSVLSKCKVSADGWLNICRQWHQLGGRGSATMMFGHMETPAERIEHLEKIRALQDETNGFTAFICWTFQPGNTEMSHLRKVGMFEYLKMLAISRLFLDNFANLQASWVTQGPKGGQLALRFGANDFGSLMIEENVVAATGTSFRTSREQICELIRGAGYVPRKRDVFYRLYE